MYICRSVNVNNNIEFNIINKELMFVLAFSMQWYLYFFFLLLIRSGSCTKHIHFEESEGPMRDMGNFHINSYSLTQFKAHI